MEREIHCESVLLCASGITEKWHVPTMCDQYYVTMYDQLYHEDICQQSHVGVPSLEDRGVHYLLTECDSM